MEEMFADFKGCDVQAARIVWKREGKMEGGVQKLISLVRRKMRKKHVNNGHSGHIGRRVFQHYFNL